MQLQGRNLSLHMKGEDVTLLHSKLLVLGYQLDDKELEEAVFHKSARKAVLSAQVYSSEIVYVDLVSASWH
jgi:hypothetical protein